MLSIAALSSSILYSRYRENPSNTTKGDLLLHKATSFNPTIGSSSGDYVRIKEIKST
jgi:hypothetical protein